MTKIEIVSKGEVKTWWKISENGYTRVIAYKDFFVIEAMKNEKKNKRMMTHNTSEDLTKEEMKSLRDFLNSFVLD